MSRPVKAMKAMPARSGSGTKMNSPTKTTKRTKRINGHKVIIKELNGKLHGTTKVYHHDELISTFHFKEGKLSNKGDYAIMYNNYYCLSVDRDGILDGVIEDDDEKYPIEKGYCREEELLFDVNLSQFKVDIKPCVPMYLEEEMYPCVLRDDSQTTDFVYWNRELDIEFHFSDKKLNAIKRDGKHLKITDENLVIDDGYRYEYNTVDNLIKARHVNFAKIKVDHSCIIEGEKYYLDIKDDEILRMFNCTTSYPVCNNICDGYHMKVKLHRVNISYFVEYEFLDGVKDTKEYLPFKNLECDNPNSSKVTPARLEKKMSRPVKAKKAMSARSEKKNRTTKRNNGKLHGTTKVYHDDELIGSFHFEKGKLSNKPCIPMYLEGEMYPCVLRNNSRTIDSVYWNRELDIEFHISDKINKIKKNGKFCKFQDEICFDDFMEYKYDEDSYKINCKPVNVIKVEKRNDVMFCAFNINGTKLFCKIKIKDDKIFEINNSKVINNICDGMKLKLYKIDGEYYIRYSEVEEKVPIRCKSPKRCESPRRPVRISPAMSFPNEEESERYFTSIIGVIPKRLSPISSCRFSPSREGLDCVQEETEPRPAMSPRKSSPKASLSRISPLRLSPVRSSPVNLDIEPVDQEIPITPKPDKEFTFCHEHENKKTVYTVINDKLVKKEKFIDGKLKKMVMY